MDDAGSVSILAAWEEHANAAARDSKQQHQTRNPDPETYVLKQLININIQY